MLCELALCILYILFFCFSITYRGILRDNSRFCYFSNSSKSFVLKLCVCVCVCLFVSCVHARLEIGLGYHPLSLCNLLLTWALSLYVHFAVCTSSTCQDLPSSVHEFCSYRGHVHAIHVIVTTPALTVVIWAQGFWTWVSTVSNCQIPLLKT